MKGKRKDPRAPICVGPKGFCKKPAEFRDPKTGAFYCYEHAPGHDVERIKKA